MKRTNGSTSDSSSEKASDKIATPQLNMDNPLHNNEWATALETASRRFYLMLSSLRGAVLALTSDDRVEFANQSFCDYFGVSESPQELLGCAAAEIIKKIEHSFGKKDDMLIRIRELVNNNEIVLGEEVTLSDGRTFLRDFIPINLDGMGHGRLWFHLDITDRKRAEENLRISASVFANAQEAILICDAHNTIVDVNPAFTRITGFTRDEVLGKNPSLLGSGHHDRAFYEAIWRSLGETGSWRGEIWNRRKSGEVYPELLSISAIRGPDGSISRYVAVFSDITLLKKHEADLRQIAYYDALTGVPNRALLADRMRQAVAGAIREKNMLAVCYLDLDGFKPINDTFGHEAGDKVLVEVARRISHAIRESDTVARMGGDEFVVLLLGLAKVEECASSVERVIAAIEQPMTIMDQQISLQVSVGVSLYPADDGDAETLLRHADKAMYIAKRAGTLRYHIYETAETRPR